MNYYRYYQTDVVNGKGTRCVLFVCGCEHRCRGCYNQATWPFDAGFPMTKELEDQIIADVCDKRIRRRGFSLSGGEPLHPRNFEGVYHLLERIRHECPPEKDIWMWTGYTLEELTQEQMRIVDLVDVLIDGKYVESLRDKRLVWRGSSNQRIHEFDRSGSWWKTRAQQ